MNYNKLSDQTSNKIKGDRARDNLSPLAFDESNVQRRVDSEKDRASVWRTAFIRDIDKIMHCPYYNRYADKTQVFSFYKNDDISRRALHVQLVSRIARTIGKALCLNLDLIEAIALGHDIGHTPFGHAGERYLDQIFYERCHKHFCHNIHSVRVLDKIFPYNLSLQTLSGIASHDGEMELDKYVPKPLADFEEFDRSMDSCVLDKDLVRTLSPSTLEGCVVRISDIIAYLGKDRQDADKAKIVDEDVFSDSDLGKRNAEIINNLIVDIIENSYGKPYIMLSPSLYEELQKVKDENYARIYKNESVCREFDDTIKPMMEDMYQRLLDDLLQENKDSPIFCHHIDFINRIHYERKIPYEQTDPHQIVVDFIASMTDDYFIDLYAKLFPDSSKSINYKGYFD